jgi:hypothetical protein
LPAAYIQLPSTYIPTSNRIDELPGDLLRIAVTTLPNYHLGIYTYNGFSANLIGASYVWKGLLAVRWDQNLLYASFWNSVDSGFVILFISDGGNFYTPTAPSYHQ